MDTYSLGSIFYEMTFNMPVISPKNAMRFKLLSNISLDEATTMSEKTREKKEFLDCLLTQNI